MKPKNDCGLRSMILLSLLLFAPGLACPGTEAPARRFMATAGANAFRASSGAYRDIYGQAVVMPEIKITCMVFRNFTLWGGYGFSAKKGFIEEAAEASEIRQKFISIGLGYARKLSARLRLRGEVGLVNVMFREEALQLVQEGSGLGWKVGADLDYFIGKNLFVFLAAGYGKAEDTVEAGRIELGGAQAGAGLGFAF